MNPVGRQQAGKMYLVIDFVEDIFDPPPLKQILLIHWQVSNFFPPTHWLGSIHLNPNPSLPLYYYLPSFYMQQQMPHNILLQLPANVEICHPAHKAIEI